MAAQPDYIDWRHKAYLDQQEAAEAARERLNAQTAAELRKRDTWENGMVDAAYEKPGYPNPILDALMAEDFTEAGRLIHKHITERFAVEQAQDAIDAQDEDAENGFYA